MSDTLLVVWAHSQVADTLARHWPYWEKSGCDILGVDRANTKTRWPKPLKLHRSIGIEGYVNGANHLTRFLQTLAYCLTLDGYSDYCIIEYDCVTFQPLPKFTGGFAAYLAGHRSPGFRAEHFYHCPWWTDRATAKTLIAYGSDLLVEGIIEEGFIDRWLGVVAERAGITVKPVPGYSHNTLDRPEFIQGARAAVKSGLTFVHGIKTAEQLRQVTR